MKRLSSLVDWYIPSLLVLAVIVVSFVMATFAQSQDFPNKVVQIVVPYPPGGTSDITARILGKRLEKEWGQPVVVVNKPGGGGALGIQTVATAKPDGYTVLTSPPGIILIPLITPGTSFSLKDFTPLSIAVSIPNVVTVNQNSPFKDFEALVDHARKNPEKLNYSSAGPGTTPHFAGELFKLETKTDITHVPMGGEAPAVTGLLGGHVDLSFVSLGAVQKHLKAGTLRALAVMYPFRVKDFPDLPTTKEKGYPGLLATAWHGYFVPAKTPPGIVNKLALAFKKVMLDSEVRDLIWKAGMLVDNFGPEEAGNFLKAEEAKWARVAKVANIQAK